jgi:hypothetical protein
MLAPQAGGAAAKGHALHTPAHAQVPRNPASVQSAAS